MGEENVRATLTVAVPAERVFALREDVRFPPFGPEHLTNSLHHLAELAAATSRSGS